MRLKILKYTTLACIITCIYYLIYLKYKHVLWNNYKLPNTGSHRYPILSVKEFSSLKLSREDKYNWSSLGKLSGELVQFAPALTSSEYKLYLELISVFKSTCELNNITYILEGGSLLGAYRYHGFIPWDDDFDVKIHTVQKPVLKKALESVKGHNVDTSENHVWKFWNEKNSWRSQNKWRWPFIDILFFEDNSTHIYDVTPNVDHRIFYPKSDIFPVRNEIFENMFLPVPRHMEVYLNRKYKMNEICSSSEWSHKKGSVPAYPPVRISCNKLVHMYPVVVRYQRDNSAYEELRLGSKVLYRIQQPIAL